MFFSSFLPDLNCILHEFFFSHLNRWYPSHFFFGWLWFFWFCLFVWMKFLFLLSVYMKGKNRNKILCLCRWWCVSVFHLVSFYFDSIHFLRFFPNCSILRNKKKIRQNFTDFCCCCWNNNIKKLKNNDNNNTDIIILAIKEKNNSNQYKTKQYRNETK